MHHTALHVIWWGAKGRRSSLFFSRSGGQVEAGAGCDGAHRALGVAGAGRQDACARPRRGLRFDIYVGACALIWLTTLSHEGE